MKNETILIVSILSVMMLTAPADAISSVNTQPVMQNINLDGTITIYLNVTPGTNISGMQTNIKFDPTIIKIDSIQEGNLLNRNNQSTFFSQGKIDNINGSVINIFNVVLGRYSTNIAGTFIEIHGTPLTKGTSKIELYNIKIAKPDGNAESLSWTNGTVVIESPSWDVNQDGIVDILDLTIVASHFGDFISGRWDANGIAPVDIYDLVHVTRHW